MLLSNVDDQVISDIDNEEYQLSDVEMETLRRAAFERSLAFDESRRQYTRRELKKYGLVREAYTRDELRERGFRTADVSSFDDHALRARDLLKVDAPFGSGIEKWQLPVDMMPIRVHETVYPPGSIVTSHMHPKNSEADPGGGLRIITQGRVFYDGRVYGPGDWFFVLNGSTYAFTTDPEGMTVVMYLYRFFQAESGNRFSHPIAADE
jgi:hypothetical protein